MITDENRIDLAIRNFIDLEKQLLECMEFIPLIDQNNGTVSPKFIPIILESCSLIESIFKGIAADEKRTYGFRKYAELHEKNLQLEGTISIFLSSPIRFYQPYQNWTQIVPNWWNSYNKLKHDRLNNYEFATYESAILALAALHQLMSKCRIFTDNLIKAGWVSPSGEFLAELITDRLSESGLPLSLIPCESSLLVSPLTFNFVSFREGAPVIDNCDFSNRVKIMLTMEGL